MGWVAHDWNNDWNNDTFTMLAHVEICTNYTDPITELL